MHSKCSHRAGFHCWNTVEKCNFCSKHRVLSHEITYESREGRTELWDVPHDGDRYNTVLGHLDNREWMLRGGLRREIRYLCECFWRAIFKHSRQWGQNMRRLLKIYQVDEGQDWSSGVDLSVLNERWINIIRNKC